MNKGVHNTTPRIFAALVLIAGVIWIGIIVFFRSSPTGAYGQFGDEAIIIQGAERVVNGQVPHRDFYSFLVGGTYYPLAVMFRIFGDSYNVVRAFNFMVAVSIVFGLTWLSWPLLRHAAVAASAVFAFLVYPVWPFASHHWTVLLLAIVSIGLIAQHRTAKSLATAGALAMGGIWIIHQRALLLVVTQIVFLVLFMRTKHEFKRLLVSYLLGVGAVVVVGLMLIALTGSWHEFFRQVIVNNILYYQQQVGQDFFVTNEVSLTILASILLLMIPLWWRKGMVRERREQYAGLFFGYLAMSVSILYFLEWIHFIQVSILAVPLALAILRDAATSAKGYGRNLIKMNLIGRYIVTTFVLVGLASYVGLVSQLAYGPARLGLLKTQYSLSTPKGTVYVNSAWRSPVVAELPAVAELVRNQFANTRIFFLPYATGYYYFNKIENYTSFDFMTTDVLRREDQEWLERDLRDKVDVVIYIPNSWQIDVQNATMQFIRQHFPFTASYLKNRIQVFSKKPIPAT